MEHNSTYRFSKEDLESKKSFDFDNDAESVRAENIPQKHPEPPQPYKHTSSGFEEYRKYSLKKDLGSLPSRASMSSDQPTLVGSSNFPTGGARQGPYLPRGVRKHCTRQKTWLPDMQNILRYEFRNPDLLEEALESPGSGIACVGQSKRHCVKGNKQLAIVGRSVIKLVLRDLCYALSTPKDDGEKLVNKIIDKFNFERIGDVSGIEKYIRPRAPLARSKRHNLLALGKDDIKREHGTVSISRGIEAIVGAVYYDGGIDPARQVMANLDLIIKMPQR
ncbi:hypothetical protein BJ875DRAFT_471050 [Amylocarpus encephaloides]|uniref:RNase III domain-containing protein n=1 Tax=Amylocarpus encephaloides TaxID=45428 RepID=A0A9P7YBU5_9HELO|nr:hypothetical protein BJ875DRAFT_471050 [Amylocarpus encephaloides]